MATEFDVGDLVSLRTGVEVRQIGVVSQPIGADSPGHVLTVMNDAVVGVSVSMSDVTDADTEAEGFTQLAYGLNTLSSKVIEQRLLVYGPDR